MKNVEHSWKVLAHIFYEHLDVELLRFKGGINGI